METTSCLANIKFIFFSKSYVQIPPNNTFFIYIFIYIYIFFFVINIFYLFFHTQQHNIHIFIYIYIIYVDKIAYKVKLAYRLVILPVMGDDNGMTFYTSVKGILNKNYLTRTDHISISRQTNCP